MIISSFAVLEEPDNISLLYANYRWPQLQEMERVLESSGLIWSSGNVLCPQMGIKRVWLTVSSQHNGTYYSFPILVQSWEVQEHFIHISKTIKYQEKNS